MKVAICFSGAIRSFDDCIGSTLKYLINNFENPDIFLHMWTFSGKEENSNINYNFKWRKENSPIEKIINILNPIKYVIDEYSSDWEKKIIEESNIDTSKFDTEQKKNYGFNCCSMYWKIFKCFELVEEYSNISGIKYDLVIRARLDFIWEDYIGMINFNNLIDDNIFLIKDRYATCSKLITNDKFFAGNFLIMKKMCNVFNDLKKYQNDEICIEGQTINAYHIKQMEFKVQWIGHSKTYYKFMGRHQIIPNNQLIDVSNIINNDITNELIYSLLSNGYNVFSLSNISNYNKINNRFFETYNHDMVNNIVIKNDNMSIIINYNNNRIIKLILDENVIKQIEKNNYYLIDFIVSLLSNIHTIQIDTFIFNNISQINNIKTDELVNFKYMDHGYYICKYLNYNNKNHCILFDNKNIKVGRESFKIVNLIKYYEDNVLPIN